MTTVFVDLIVTSSRLVFLQRFWPFYFNIKRGIRVSDAML